MLALGGLSGSCLSSATFNAIDYDEDCILDEAIGVFLKGSPELTKLTMVDLFDSPITDAAVESVVLHCPHIEVLSLKDWSLITDLSLTYLTQLSSLREIDLSRCFQLTSAAVQGLLKANQKLKVLILSHIVEDFYVTNPALIDNALLRCIGLNCPDLVKLHLRLEPEADDFDVAAASFEAMIEGLPALEEFRLAYYEQPNTVSPMLGLYCPRLKHFWLHDVSCSDEDLIRMCRGCPLIETLYLHNTDNITDISIRALAAHCTMLKELTVYNVDHITDDSLCILFSTCTHLTSVRLSDLKYITDKVILTLLKHCLQLRNLSLVNCFGLTDYCILAIPTHCPLLQTLEVECMLTLSHDTIVQLSTHCKYLQYLSFKYCSNLHNDSVLSILKNCQQLIKLYIHSSNIQINKDFSEQCNELTCNKRYRKLNLACLFGTVESV